MHHSFQSPPWATGYTQESALGDTGCRLTPTVPGADITTLDGHLAAILEYQLQQDGMEAWLDTNLCRTHLRLPIDHLLQSPPGCSWVCRFTGLNHSWITEWVSADGTTPRISTSLFSLVQKQNLGARSTTKAHWNIQVKSQVSYGRGRRGFPTLLMGSSDSTLVGKKKQRTHSLFTCKF